MKRVRRGGVALSKDVFKITACPLRGKRGQDRVALKTKSIERCNEGKRVKGRLGGMLNSKKRRGRSKGKAATMYSSKALRVRNQGAGGRVDGRKKTARVRGS